MRKRIDKIKSEMTLEDIINWWWMRNICNNCPVKCGDPKKCREHVAAYLNEEVETIPEVVYRGENNGDKI